MKRNKAIKKKVFFIFLSALMLVTLYACSNKENSRHNDSSFVPLMEPTNHVPDTLLEHDKDTYESKQAEEDKEILQPEALSSQDDPIHLTPEEEMFIGEWFMIRKNYWVDEWDYVFNADKTGLILNWRLPGIGNIKWSIEGNILYIHYNNGATNDFYYDFVGDELHLALIIDETITRILARERTYQLTPEEELLVGEWFAIEKADDSDYNGDYIFHANKTGLLLTGKNPELPREIKWSIEESAEGHILFIEYYSGNTIARSFSYELLGDELHLTLAFAEDVAFILAR